MSEETRTEALPRVTDTPETLLERLHSSRGTAAHRRALRILDRLRAAE